MDLTHIGLLKAKVIEWYGNKNVDINVETAKSLMYLFVSQTYPTTKTFLEAADKMAGHRVTADEIEGVVAKLLAASDRRISLHYFNNNTVGISRKFRDSGEKLLKEATECRKEN